MSTDDPPFSRIGVQLAAAEILEKLCGLLEPAERACILAWCGNDLVLDAKTHESLLPADASVDTGCVSFMVLGAICAAAVHEGRIQWTDPVTRHLATVANANGPLRDQLDRIQIHHLLSHTHGLDNLAHTPVPMSPSRSIDADQLLQKLAGASPIAEPGAIFCNSHVGPWLATAILEEAYGKPLVQVLHDHLPHIDAGLTETAGLRLSARHVLELARPHVEREHALWALFHELRELHSYTPSAWQPFFRRVCLGLFDYGDGCFGHIGLGLKDSIAVRVFPERELVIVIAANARHSAQKVINHVFPGTLGPSGVPGTPRLLTAAEWLACDPRVFTGAYENSSIHVVIEIGRTGSLTANAFQRREGGNPHQLLAKRRLLPARDNVFVAQQPEPAALSLLRYALPRPSGAFDVLYANGNALRRVT